VTALAVDVTRAVACAAASSRGTRGVVGHHGVEALLEIVQVFLQLALPLLRVRVTTARERDGGRERP
jgi:hypothetical protein